MNQSFSNIDRYCNPVEEDYKVALAESWGVLDAVRPEGECIELMAMGEIASDAACN